MKTEIKRFFAGFGYAAQGIGAALRQERNLRFHCCAAAYVLVFSRFYTFSPVEYALLFLCIGGVMALELMNSALERAVHQPYAAHWETAGAAKDMAAGAVLVFSIAAACVGVVLFWQPAVLARMLAWFAARPWAICLLAASVPAAVCFVCIPKKRG